MGSKNSRALREIDRTLRARQGPCWICGHPIDYTRPYHREDGTCDPDAFTIEHIHPRSTHPHLEHDPGNCVPAHARCNKQRGNRPYHPNLGTPTQDW
ncbi:HNH endonuclease [Skermania piniformis]|uniref:HNH endonuclease n=1 Tax=Skermania pinensis TaxID=39122 RepID=A0ABX8SAH2_9ACTN|nr:HNH endonuclease [Skermania piniformis]QXQ14860.1 HNH endonuclease [Skermania piniformis]